MSTSQTTSVGPARLCKQGAFASQARHWLLPDRQGGRALADTRFDGTATLCKRRDPFSRH